MKKLLVILLLMVYGLSSTGMTVNFHYCCGKLKKVEFSSAQVECRMKMKHSSGKKCCDNQQVEFKVKADQKITESGKTIISGKAFITDVATSSSYSSFAFANSIHSKTLIPSVFAPPPLANYPLYVLNCIYRI